MPQKKGIVAENVAAGLLVGRIGWGFGRFHTTQQVRLRRVVGKRLPPTNLYGRGTFMASSGRDVQGRPLFLLLAVLTLGGLPSGRLLTAQTVRGHLFEAGSRSPVASGTVMLLDTTYTVAVSTLTSQEGFFSITAEEPGDYFIVVQTLGYHPVVDGILELGEGGEITLEINLRPSPLELDSLEVVVRRTLSERRLGSTGFFQRAKNGFGHHLTPEEIEKRDPQILGDLFRGIPGLVVSGWTGAGTQLIILRPGRGTSYCRPRIYVDGALAYVGAGGLETLVAAKDVAAVEVYTRGSSAPLQYGGTAAACGVVLIWTK